MHDFFADFGIFLFAQFRQSLWEKPLQTYGYTYEYKDAVTQNKAGVSKHSGAYGDVIEARK